MSRTLQHALLLAALTPLVASAGTLLPASAGNGFPQCAYSCATLQGAAASCQADPSGQQAIISSCFCQSSLLTTLHSSPNGVCDSACTSSSDLTSLENWYNNFCSSATQAATAQTTTASSGTTQSTSSTTSAAATATSSKSSSSSSSSRKGSSTTTPTWWQSHYRWIIMLVILLLAALLLSLLAVWLKRRARARKQNPNHRAATPPPFVGEKRSNRDLREKPNGLATQNPNQSQLSLTHTVSTRTNTLMSSKFPSLTSRARSGSLLSSQTRNFSGNSNASRGDMRDMWGPAQHMAATRGWEYTSNGVVERGDTNGDEITPVSRTGTSHGPGNANGLHGQRSKEPFPDIQEVEPSAHPALRGEQGVTGERIERDITDRGDGVRSPTQQLRDEERRAPSRNSSSSGRKLRKRDSVGREPRNLK